MIKGIINNCILNKKGRGYSVFFLFLLVPLVFWPYNSNIFNIPKISFLAFFTIIYVLLSVYYLLKKKSINIKLNKFVCIGLLFWSLSLIISTIFSAYPSFSLWGSYTRQIGLLSHFLFLLFFCFSLNHFLNNTDRTKILKFVIYVFSVISLYALAQKLGFDIYSKGNLDTFLGRPFSTLGQPNFLGQSLLFPIWISIYFIFYKKEKIFSIFLLLFLFVLLFTENRASILGLICSFGLFLFYKFKLSKKFLIGTLIAALIGGACLVYLSKNNLRSLNARIIMFESSVKLIPENPVFGYGLNTLKYVFPLYVDKEIHRYEMLYDSPDKTHNQYIDILVEQGMFGFLIFFIINLYIFLKAINTKNKELKYFLAPLAALLISINFSFFTISDFILYLFFLSICLSILLKFKTKTIQLNFIRKFIIVFLICSFAIFGSNYYFNLMKADKLNKTGMGYLYNNKITLGLRYLDYANNLNPHQDSITYKLVHSLYALDDFQSAYNVLIRKRDFSDMNFIFLLEKARILNSLREYEKAENIYKTVMSMAPNNPVLWRDFGKMYYEKGDYIKAIEKFEGFLALSPDYWKDYNHQNRKHRVFFKTAKNFWDVLKYLRKSNERLGNNDQYIFYNNIIKKLEADGNI